MIQSCSLALHFYFLYNTRDTFMQYLPVEHKGRMEKHLFGLCGERIFPVAVGEHTESMLAYPAPSKSTKDSVKALRHWSS